MSLSRAERRRQDREIEKIKPHGGLGFGWRRSGGGYGNKYLVKEPPDVSLEDLIAESQAIYLRLYPKTVR
jgi:hypothetical protein